MNNLTQVITAIGQDIKAIKNTWSYFVLEYVLDGNIIKTTNGEILPLRKGNERVYRFISNDGSEDTIYANMDSTSLLLTDKIIRRGE